jgi:hypothetical protein
VHETESDMKQLEDILFNLELDAKDLREVCDMMKKSIKRIKHTSFAPTVDTDILLNKMENLTAGRPFMESKPLVADEAQVEKDLERLKSLEPIRKVIIPKNSSFIITVTTKKNLSGII